MGSSMKIEKVNNRYIVYISTHHAKVFYTLKEAKEFISRLKHLK